jgi:hypothetical protein
VKFNSRKDPFFITFFIVLIGFFLIGIIHQIMIQGNIILVILLLVICLFFLFLLFGLSRTQYELTHENFTYQSVWLKGKIELDQIREILVGRTQWVGLKPAFARKGLILKFGKYDEIYISPDNNETFIQEILRRNPKIKITFPF